MNLALDDVRAAKARRMVQDGYEPVLKKSRWCVLKRPENLTDKQYVKLRDVLRYSLASVRALAEGDIPRLMWLRLAHLGGQVPGPVDKPGDALSH
jgi:transposase